MNYVAENTKLAIKLLEGILSGEVDRIDSGLCLYLNPSDSRALAALIERLTSKWVKASSSTYYIIPDPAITVDKGFSCEQEYRGAVVIYEKHKLKKLNFIDRNTEYGLLRLELAEYLLDSLNKVYKEMYAEKDLCLKKSGIV